MQVEKRPFGARRRGAFFFDSARRDAALRRRATPRGGRRAFRRFLCALLTVVSVSPFLFGEPILLPELGGTDRLEVLEKENVRRRVDGRYEGYVYREYRGVLSRTGETSAGERYQGAFYVLEDLSMLGSTSRRLEDRVETELVLSDRGLRSTDEHGDYPRTLSFPVFPAGRVEAGERWRDYGVRVVDPKLDGTLTRVRFYCEYRFDGLGELYGDKVYRIRAQYALRYRAGDDPYGDPELTSVQGSHVADVLLYADGSGRVFVRTQVDEAYTYRDGTRITSQGFLLTWLRQRIRLNREETIRQVEKTLGEEGTRDVRVESKDEGVSISLEKIHFIPDSPRILPDEVDRLDTLYRALSQIPDRTFLVVGHTADIGTAESQVLLSIERAKTVISGLVERGLPADRFIYTGKGGTEPIGSNDTEEGRAKNRRVEIVILDG